MSGTLEGVLSLKKFYCFFKRTSIPIPLATISYSLKALAAARRSNCSFVVNPNIILAKIQQLSWWAN
jgi:hypothetical protein